jgi:small subunit ribosomal protein S7
MQIRPDRKISMAMKWLNSLKKKKKSMAQRLANECLAAAKEESAVKKKWILTKWQKLISFLSL